MKKDLKDMIGSKLKDITVKVLVLGLMDRMVSEGTCVAGVAIQVGPEVFTLTLQHVHDKDVLAQLVTVDPKSLN